ncbi:MAG: hypothetical protein PVH18_13055 [Chloroflexota bacterium]|jgi:hypothetical protein
MENKIEELAELLSMSEQAHHQAYIDTDGFDPEWPIWYADYLMPRLLPLLGITISKSELIYLLVHLSKIQPVDAPDASWPRYYAQYLVERYS